MSSILLVEDDEAAAFFVAKQLRAAGHDVVEARSSIEALDVLETSRKLDVLLADIVLMKGQPNGLSLTRMARMKRPEIKVALMTAHRDIAGDETTLPGPLFYKPLDFDELFAAIGRMTARA